MSFVYYNEWDSNAAEWLRELIRRGELPAGEVDTRSITEVDATDLKGFTSWHFFAGIGGWPLALRMAGVPDDFSVLTGSPPCQPFSVAGLQKGKEDERHLAPVWLDIIKEHRPKRIVGEQVEAAIGKGWLDDLFDALEREGYACGAAVLPACSVGAPHIRKRLFFGAVRLADANGEPGKRDARGIYPPQEGEYRTGQLDGTFPERYQHGGATNGMADTASIGRNRRRSSQARNEPGSIERSDGLRNACWTANTNDTRPQGRTRMPERSDEQPSGTGGLESGSANPHNGFWSGADWLGCRDGKFRPVEPGTQPLAHGLPARVGRLRGYGNAIVPQVAATFVTEFFESVETLQLLGDL